MPHAIVHLYDHRTGERRTAEGDYWYQPGFWSLGDGARDCNRTILMYGQNSQNALGSDFVLNLIVVEKIVHEGTVVYQETIHPLPPLVITMLEATNRMSHLEFLFTNLRNQRMEEVRWAAGDLKALRGNLRRSTRESAVLEAFDQVVEVVESAVRTANLEAPDWSLGVTADEIEDACFAFKQLTQAACGAYKERPRI